MNNCDNSLFFNEIYLHIISIALIILFSIISGIYTLVSPESYVIIRLLALCVVVAAIYLGSNKNTYLPFLGKTVIPLNIIPKEKIPHGANIDFKLPLKGYPNGTMIFYWGAKSTDNKVVISDPMKAYGDFSNSGVAIVNNESAVLRFFCPDKYSVKPFNSVLNRHLHYRIECPKSGLMSAVKTVYVDC